MRINSSRHIHRVYLLKYNHRNTGNFQYEFLFENGKLTKSNPKKKVINLKKQGVSDKKNNDIAAENCGESSFQEGLAWRDGRKIA